MTLQANSPILIDPGPSPRGWHRLEVAIRCLQLYAFSHHKDAGPREPSSAEPLVVGSLVHVGVAHFRARQRQDQNRLPRDAYYEPATAIELLAEKNGSGWTPHVDRAQRIVSAYIEHWSAKEHGVRPLHVEELFEIRYPCTRGPIRRKERNAAGMWTGGWIEENEVLVTARVDLVYEKDGKVYLADTKTSGRLNGTHAGIYSISGQLLNYRWIGQLLYGARFGGIVLDLVQTGDIGKFERPPLDPAPALFSKFPQIVEDIERRIAALEDEDRAINDWPAAASELVCIHRYGRCSAFERCKWGL